MFEEGVESLKMEDLKDLKSYAYENSEKHGWEWWQEQYSKSLTDEVFGEKKKQNSSGGIYSDPDEGNVEYYTQICHFLNSQEKILESKRYHYCVGKYNGKARINVCENGKFIFCLKSDQFGFSVPRTENKPNPQNVCPHPYSIYYEKEKDKSIAIYNIVKWVYITRTIGGSFLWPEEEKYKQPPYNNDRGGSQHPQRSSYINDRVDLTLLEIKHFYDIKEQLKEPEYDDFIGEYKKKKPKDVLCNSLEKSPNLYEWLMHFDSFDTYIEYFKFDMFTSKNEDGVIDGVIDITTEGNCLEEVDDKELIKKDFWNKIFKNVFDRLCSKIRERTREIEKSIEGNGN